MRKTLAAVLVGASLGGSALAQSEPARTLTLADAFERALTANPQVGIARGGVNVAEARRLLSRSLVFPQLSVNGSLTRNSEEASFGEGSDARVILPEDDWTYGLQFRQPLFAGLREKRAYDQAKLGIESANEGLLDTENLILLQVGIDYLAMVRAVALAGVEEKNVELARGRKRQATDFYEVGEVTRVDVLRADAGIKSAERQLVVAQAARKAAVSRLRVALALEGEEDLEGVAPEELLPPLASEVELVQRAASASPAIQQARIAVAIAELEVKKQRGAYLPVLFLDGGWLRQKSAFPSDDYGFLALNFNLPIFQGGETRARVNEAEEQLAQARLHAEDLERAIREEVRTALLEVETSRALLALAREEQASAQQEHAQSLELYRAQETSALDLETAETALADATRRIVFAQIAIQTAELRVWYLTGELKNAAAAGPAQSQKEQGQ